MKSSNSFQRYYFSLHPPAGLCCTGSASLQGGSAVGISFVLADLSPYPESQLRQIPPPLARRVLRSDEDIKSFLI